MSKKSYKRNQNRLYREIKRRIIAEQKIVEPVKITTCNLPVETLKIRSIIRNSNYDGTCDKERLEFTKHDMANKIAHKLLEDGYIVFQTFEHDDVEVSEDEVILAHTEIEATLNVVRQWN